MMTFGNALKLRRNGEWLGGGGAAASKHRYYRLYFFATNGRNTINIAEVKLRATIGGANIAVGGTPSASNEFSGAFAAGQAFDGNAATFWSTAANVTRAWLQYDLGAGNEAAVLQYSIQARHDAHDGSPLHWVLEGSADAVAWEVLHGATDESGWANGEVREYTV